MTRASLLRHFAQDHVTVPPLPIASAFSHGEIPCEREFFDFVFCVSSASSSCSIEYKHLLQCLRDMKEKDS